MARIMSPTAPDQEASGLLAAQRYAEARHNATAQELRDAAENLWKYYAPRNEAFANSLRDGLYIASQMRDA